MNWIERNPELAVAIAGAVFAILGYYFRSRRENQENLKEALYLLAEIWHRSVLPFNFAVQKLMETLIQVVQSEFPQWKLTTEQETEIRDHFAPILEKNLRIHAMDGMESLYETYGKVINLIARADPVLAYDLDAASVTKRRLAYMDQYLKEAIHPLGSQGGPEKFFSENLIAALKAETERNVADDLEINLRRLAWILGPITWLRISARIFKRKRKLKNGPDKKRASELLQNVMLPAAEAYLAAKEDEARRAARP